MFVTIQQGGLLCDEKETNSPMIFIEIAVILKTATENNSC